MTTQTTPPTRSTIELRDDLASGALSAVTLTEACIDRISAREAEVKAWAWFDADAALRQAKRLDELRASGASLGPLHGLPVAVKDIIDTAGIPTENGSALDVGRVPDTDATVVQRLKAAGAITFGKTVTTELAYLQPNVTHNPHNLEHTPGGSSSGSAAAVADGMVPLAIGSQTGGSVVRPASFCGITGFKPSFNAISRQGVLNQSQSLDTLGVFASDPEGTALLASVLFENAAPDDGFLDDALADRSDPPVLGFVQVPGWERAESVLQSAFATLRETLADRVIDLTLPGLFADAVHQRATINAAEMGHNLEGYLERRAEGLGPKTQAEIERGRTIPAHAYLAALERQAAMPAALEPLFARCDAILCPAALGPAPHGLESTGDSIFNGLWTMAGTPAITLPLLRAPNGLHMGVQLVGRVGSDRELLRTARWLWHWGQSAF